MNQIDPKELTPKQRRAWDEARTGVLYQAPMFSHLLYSMLTGPNNEAAVFTRDVETAACDDSRVFINPEAYLDRPLSHRIFILAHEIAHAMFGHSQAAMKFAQAGKYRYPDGKELGFNDTLLGQAQDYFINAMLSESNIGTMPPDGLIDARFTSKVPIMDVYRTLWQEQDNGNDEQPPQPPQEGGGGGQSPGGTDPGGFDQHLPPGTAEDKNPQQAMQDRDDDRWASEIQAAAESAKAAGQLPGCMNDVLDLVQAKDTFWAEHVRALLSRTVGTGAYDWRTPDRRMITRAVDPIFAPGRRGFKCKLAVVVGDSSGSINKATEEHFLMHAAGLIEEMDPERVLFVWCDARTHGYQELASLSDVDALAKEGAKGRRGTDFRPPFRELYDMGEEPDFLLYLTDGLGPFPKEPPNYQVIWGDITGRPSLYPWGDVVHIPVQVV